MFFLSKKCNRVFCQGTEIKRINRLEVSIKIYRVLSTGSTNSVYSASRIKGKGNTSNINKSCYIDLCLPKSSLISSKDHRIAVKSDTNYRALRDKKNPHHGEADHAAPNFVQQEPIQLHQRNKSWSCALHMPMFFH